MSTRILSCLVCGYRLYGEKEIITELKKQVSSRQALQRQVIETPKCAWVGCDKAVSGGAANARPGSKYCSRDCSNKNARYRYNVRRRSAESAN